MILAIDVDYKDNETAAVAGVLFDHWGDAKPKEILITHVDNIAPYVSGQFYKRELPCILALLEKCTVLPEIIVLDGYVDLGEGRKGLGAHLYDALNAKVIIIGVAKNPFQDIATETEIFRGKSKKALYITALGISQEKAKLHIKNMHGEYRFPTLLKEVDTLCRLA